MTTTRRRLRRGRPFDARARSANLTACQQCCQGATPCRPSQVLSQLKTVLRFGPRVRLASATPPHRPGIYRIIAPSGIVLSVGRAADLANRIGQHQNEHRRTLGNPGVEVSWATVPTTAALARLEYCDRCRRQPTRDYRELAPPPWREFERAFEAEL